MKHSIQDMTERQLDEWLDSMFERECYPQVEAEVKRERERRERMKTLGNIARLEF
jgi:hypothetical protein